MFQRFTDRAFDVVLLCFIAWAYIAAAHLIYQTTAHGGRIIEAIAMTATAAALSVFFVWLKTQSSR